MHIRQRCLFIPPRQEILYEAAKQTNPGNAANQDVMEIPAGHDRNADQIAYWNGPGGQRWTDRQQAQDIMRLRGDVGCAGAARRCGRPCPRHRHLGADACPGAADRACGFAG
jgi:hypothetical protein